MGAQKGYFKCFDLSFETLYKHKNDFVRGKNLKNIAKQVEFWVVLHHLTVKFHIKNSFYSALK